MKKTRSMDLFKLEEYKRQLPLKVLKAIVEYKTEEDHKTINQWIQSTEDKSALDEEGNSVVHLAIKKCHPTLAKWFLEQGIDVDILNREDTETPLIAAIVAAAEQKPGSETHKEFLKLIEFLIEKHAYLYVTPKTGFCRYALDLAVYRCDLDVIKLLVEKAEADVNVIANELTPMERALISEHARKQEVIDYLQSQGAVHPSPSATP